MGISQIALSFHGGPSESPKARTTSICDKTRDVKLIDSSSVSFCDGSFRRLAFVTPFVVSPDCCRANSPS
ncbi:hypothetical protein M758_1G168100 [Ceratodon purpureus]|nr:hypothetical protein M758_1G168100 [Ceratodon purpureus]